MKSLWLCSLLALAAFSSIAALSGCAERPKETLDFSAVESHMKTAADSSLMLLDSLHAAGLANGADSARYALLRTEALYKLGEDETSDTLIREAVAYYSTADDSRSLGQALFHQGRILLNIDSISEAAVRLLRAEDAAKAADDHFTLGRVYAYLFDTYTAVFECKVALRYALQSVDEYTKYGDSRYVFSSMSAVAQGYNNLLDFDNSKAVTTKIIEECQDSLRLAVAHRFRATSAVGLKDFPQAVADFEKALSYRPTILSEIDYENLAFSYLECGDSISASHILKGLGYSSPSELYKNLDKMREDMLRTSIAQDVTLNVNRQIEQASQNRLTSSKKKLIFSIIAFLFVSAAIAVYFKLRKKKLIRAYERQIGLKTTEQTNLESKVKYLLQSTDTLISKLENLKEENSSLIANVSNLKSDTFRSLDELCTLYTLNKPKGNAKLAEALFKSIKKFGEDSAVIEDLEAYANKYNNDVISKFNSEFPTLSDSQRKLFLYEVLGFSTTSICTILDISDSQLYNRKARLKKIIEESNANFKELFLRSMVPSQISSPIKNYRSV